MEPDGESFGEGRLFEPRGFAAFAITKGLDREAALKGLLGMMKFGQPDHPILLEAVGDVLIWDRRIRADGKRLAARAYLRASQSAQDPKAAAAYRARAALALVGHKGLTLAAVETAYARERRRGERFQARVAADEAKWIAAGVDVEARFARKYYKKKGRR